VTARAVPARPTVEATVQWEGGTRLAARAGGGAVALDWDGKGAVSPVQTLAIALASCMASDVVVILTRGRLPLRGLAVRVAGERAPSDPRRLLKADVRFEVAGDVPDDRVERAIALSRETYCSVWHSLARDIELETSFVVDRSAA
jgi:putative redox protein